jgi:hypothetical protein
MPKAIDTIGYFATAPGAAGAAAAAVTGDSLQIRSYTPGTKTGIVAHWAKNQATGFHQLVWPSGNDMTRGIRSVVVAGENYARLPFDYLVPIRQQELIQATIAGSAVAGDVEIGAIQVIYEDLPGIAARLVSPDEVWGRGIREVTVYDTVTPTASGTWSGARALNAGSDLLQANTDYAVLGFNISALCGAIAIRGSDTGNMRCGVPGLATNAMQTKDWFVQRSYDLEMPFIPVINSANKAATFIDILQDENNTAVVFSLNLVELSP